MAGSALDSVAFPLAVGDLLIGWLLLRHAETALGALDRDPILACRAFYSGKLTAATFFAKNVTMEPTAGRGILKNVDLAFMGLRE